MHYSITFQSLLFTGLFTSTMLAQAADAPSLFGNSSQRTAAASDRVLSHLQRANRLIGKEVEAAGGQRAGKIEDLAVDLNSGQVLYAVLGTSGGGRVAVAPEAFTQVNSDTIRVNANAQKLAGAPQVTGDLGQAGQPGGADFVNRVHQYYGQAAPAGFSNGAQMFSTVTGKEVVDNSGQKMGDINNLVVSLQAGRVVYVIMSPDAGTGVRGRLVALPPGTVSWNAGQNRFASNITRERLGSAPGFSNDDWKTVASQGFANKVAQFWSGAGTAYAGNTGTLNQGVGTAGSLGGAASPSTQMAGNTGTATGGAFGHLERGRQLIGQPVQTSEGQNAGKVDDLVVDLTSGHLLYAVVSTSGGKVAVAPGAFSDTAGNNLRLGVDAQKLNGAPKFTAEIEHPSQINKADFVYRVYQHFGQSAWWQGSASPSEGTFNNVQKVSQLMSMPIINVNDTKVATVQDVILNIPKGRILYVVISPDPSLNLGNDYFALPPSAITWNASKNSLASNLTKEQLASAPKFASNNWSQLTDPSFASRVYQYYGKQAWFGSEPVLQPTGRDSGQSLYPGNNLEL